MSLIFPENTDIDYKEREILEHDIKKHPVATFQILNNILNERGLCLCIMNLKEE